MSRTALSPRLPLAFITREQFREALIEELIAIPGITTIDTPIPGVVTCSASATLSAIAFARQVLPNYTTIHGSSISDLSLACFEYLLSVLDDSPGCWALHMLEASTVETGEIHQRASLIKKGIEGLLTKKRRSLLKRLVPAAPESGWLAQVLLLNHETLLVSVIETSCVPTIRRGPGGFVEVRDDKQPPSRAFKKLVEAKLVWSLPFEKGQTAVDLGASPGGWTHVASRWGATVTAIDRSPLAPHLMRSPRIQFIRGDAFSWKPPEKVTWLLCDVIAAPERTAQLIREWVSHNLCSHFCVTMKFKGAPPVGLIIELKSWLNEKLKWFDVYPLTNNKNEVTWVGTLT